MVETATGNRQRKVILYTTFGELFGAFRDLGAIFKLLANAK